MEEKLLELKEQFCNWYCPNKEEDLIFCSRWTECKECNEIIECDEDLPHIDFCSECKIEDFIIFARDEL
jgi:hypothetical protein